ncbi:NAD(P)H-binding protein [Novosphingobium sp.]|uniref:NmrA family NAD(P)-binding protein n=1 Tax=Novosphingobium sp. TaxID=1874826 RepID=UPI0031CE41F3
MYAITAITGRVGGALADRLLEQGQPVRAILRDAAKGAPWAARGAEVALADADDADALTAALSGAEGVFLLLPPNFDPAPDFSDVKARIAVFREALLRAKPGKVVVLSTIGADAMEPNLLTALRLLEEALANVDLPITSLRAAWFMENAQWDVAAARDKGLIASYLQPLDRKIAMIATDDVGRCAADLLLEDWAGHRIVELEAAQRVSPQDIAAALAKAIGHPVSVRAVPKVEWEGIFRAEGMANPQPRMRMIDGFNEGWIDFTGTQPDHRKGRIGIEEAMEALVSRIMRE